MVQHLNVNQWKNSTSVIKWFTVLENKTHCVFIKFDIREFYLSITEDILKISLSFANKYENIPEDNICITNYCHKSLLSSDNQPWKKKNSEGCFHITMGSVTTGQKCLNQLGSIFCHACQPLQLKRIVVFTEMTVYWSCVMSMDNKQIVLEKILFNYLKTLVFS